MNTNTPEKRPHGRDLLNGWLVANGVLPTHFARRIGAHQSTLSKILSGQRGIGDVLKVRIETETGGAVPYDSWRPTLETREAA